MRVILEETRVDIEYRGSLNIDYLLSNNTVRFNNNGVEYSVEFDSDWALKNCRKIELVVEEVPLKYSGTGYTVFTVELSFENYCFRVYFDSIDIADNKHVVVNVYLDNDIYVVDSNVVTSIRGNLSCARKSWSYGFTDGVVFTELLGCVDFEKLRCKIVGNKIITESDSGYFGVGTGGIRVLDLNDMETTCYKYKSRGYEYYMFAFDSYSTFRVILNKRNVVYCNEGICVDFLNKRLI